MGRELTIFDSDFSYLGVLDALKEEKISMTIEFFPEEGKYHFTGHRNCEVKHSPNDTDKYGVICPKCSRRLTVGVMHRVEQLAENERPEGYKKPGRPSYKKLIPLLEILSGALEVPVTSEKVKKEFESLVAKFNSEMSVLLKVSVKDIEGATTFPRISEAIRKVREGDIVVEPGFDGVFGTVKIWPRSKDDSEKSIKDKVKLAVKAEGQIDLF